MQLSRITLREAIPDVFRSEETELRRCGQSGIWLTEVTFERGRNYLVEAESGRGKSSFCAFVMGQRTDYSGQILFDGRDVRSLSHAEWCSVRRSGIAYLPQDMRLFPELTVIENLRLKNRLTDFRSEQELMQMLAAVEIEHKAKAPAALLSIGQQQRVALVRALCQPFDFLLLDEPVSHLDPRTNAVVGSLVAEAAAKQGAGVISTSVGNHLELPGIVTRIHL